MKYSASRLSEGNKVFPAEIHIEQTGLTVKIPGLFSGKTEYFDYQQISNVSVNAPMIGYSTITFHAARAKVSAHGFTSSEVKEIKLAIEGGKSNRAVSTSSNDEKLKTKKKKEKVEKQKLNIESEIGNIQHKIQVESLQADLEKIRLQNRQLKIDNLNQAYNSKPKDFLYYTKLAWVYLDKGWKKALVIFIIWAIIASIYSEVVDFIKN